VEARWSVQRDESGAWVTVERKPSSVVINDLVVVSHDVITTLAKDPRSMYSLTSRQYEEVVAELLARRGYAVELTPMSRDGGYDIYAAKKDSVGSFLYLVECKKYAPENHVGVGLVRQLHGVVQQSRATAGILATTSFFTRDAQEFAEEIKWQLSLRDYVVMTEWLQETNLAA
jgi:restriction system protein